MVTIDASLNAGREGLFGLEELSHVGLLDAREEVETDVQHRGGLGELPLHEAAQPEGDADKHEEAESKPQPGHARHHLLEELFAPPRFPHRKVARQPVQQRKAEAPANHHLQNFERAARALVGAEELLERPRVGPEALLEPEHGALAEDVCVLLQRGEILREAVHLGCEVFAAQAGVPDGFLRPERSGEFRLRAVVSFAAVPRRVVEELLLLVRSVNHEEERVQQRGFVAEVRDAGPDRLQIRRSAHKVCDERTRLLERILHRARASEKGVERRRPRHRRPKPHERGLVLFVRLRYEQDTGGPAENHRRRACAVFVLDVESILQIAQHLGEVVLQLLAVEVILRPSEVRRDGFGAHDCVLLETVRISRAAVTARFLLVRARV
mmetsp:Transcript_791/g.2887  ORF Transcript_791/g.2887 Transcript_791/m.2887 type:complete len:382 (+) Transcript_791:472-1617(+)